MSWSVAHGQNDGAEATLCWKLHLAPPAGRKGALGGQQSNMLAGTEGFRDMDQGMQGQGVREVGTRVEGGNVNTGIQLGMQKHRLGAQGTGCGDLEDAGTHLLHGDTVVPLPAVDPILGWSVTAAGVRP